MTLNDFDWLRYLIDSVEEDTDDEGEIVTIKWQTRDGVIALYIEELTISNEEVLVMRYVNNDGSPGKLITVFGNSIEEERRLKRMVGLYK